MGRAPPSPGGHPQPRGPTPRRPDPPCGGKSAARPNAPKTTRTWYVCQKFPFVRYVMEPRKGLDYARNTGWQAANGEIIVSSRTSDDGSK